MASTIHASIAMEVDEIHEQLTANAAREAARMPAGIRSQARGKDGNVPRGNQFVALQQRKKEGGALQQWNCTRRSGKWYLRHRRDGRSSAVAHCRGRVRHVCAVWRTGAAPCAPHPSVSDSNESAVTEGSRKKRFLYCQAETERERETDRDGDRQIICSS